MRFGSLANEIKRKRECAVRDEHVARIMCSAWRDAWHAWLAFACRVTGAAHGGKHRRCAARQCSLSFSHASCSHDFLSHACLPAHIKNSFLGLLDVLQVSNERVGEAALPHALDQQAGAAVARRLHARTSGQQAAQQQESRCRWADADKYADGETVAALLCMCWRGRSECWARQER